MSIQYPTRLETIGDHLRKRRLDLSLLQKQVALLIGATECSVYLWETNRTTPTFWFYPKIVEFLGYCPFNPAWSPGESLSMARKYHGISQETMARRLGVDPGTLAKWERSHKVQPFALPLDRLRRVLFN